MPPSIPEIAELFEFLDADHKGMISASEILELLTLKERLKAGNFDPEKVEKISDAKNVEI